MLLSLPLVAAAALGAPRVVFTDCDGTLLNTNHALSPASKQTLARLLDAGVRVVPATGRARAGHWTSHVLTEPALRNGLPGIFLNGCTVYDDHGPLAPATLDADISASVLELAEAQRSCAVAYYKDEALHDSDSPMIARLEEVGDAPLRRVPSLRAACAGLAITKVLLLTSGGGGGGDDATLDELRSLYGGAVGAAASMTSALPWMAEVMPPGVSKATAAAELLSRWGVRPDEALAIGDGENDLEIMGLVGTSIAMANGGEAVRAAADHLAPSNAEDGWSAAMERHVLGLL